VNAIKKILKYHTRDSASPQTLPDAWSWRRRLRGQRPVADFTIRTPLDYNDGEMTRRTFFTAVLGLSALLMGRRAFGEDEGTAEPIQTIHRSEDEWRKLLTPEQFRVLRQKGTERRFSSPLDKMTAKGEYRCAGCDLTLFTSEMKFDSKTGWPSFFTVIPGRINTRLDHSLFFLRTEYHCARCGGHHGHLFEDGPPPSGLRYCNNGVALTFAPA